MPAFGCQIPSISQKKYAGKVRLIFAVGSYRNDFHNVFSANRIFRHTESVDFFGYILFVDVSKYMLPVIIVEFL